MSNLIKYEGNMQAFLKKKTSNLFGIDVVRNYDIFFLVEGKWTLWVGYGVCVCVGVCTLDSILTVDLNNRVPQDF